MSAKTKSLGMVSPVKGGAQGVAHDAVRAIASGEPVRMRRLFAAIGVSKHRFDAIRSEFERRGLRAAFDGDAEALKSLFKQALGVRLGQHQRIIVGARHGFHFDVTDHAAIRSDDIDAVDLEPRLDERRRSRVPPVEQFERAAPQHKRLRFVRTLRRLVDNAHWNPVAGQFAREREPHRARADDQYGRVHWRSPDLATRARRFIRTGGNSSRGDLGLGCIAMLRCVHAPQRG